MSGLCDLELEGPGWRSAGRGWDAQKGRVAMTKEPYSLKKVEGLLLGDLLGQVCFAMRCDRQVRDRNAWCAPLRLRVAVGWDAQQQGKEKKAGR